MVLLAKMNDAFEFQFVKFYKIGLALVSFWHTERESSSGQLLNQPAYLISVLKKAQAIR